MNSRIALAAAALLALASSAFAACPATVTGQGRAQHGHNYDPPRKYDTEALARTRAISSWADRVRAECPGRAADWGAARNAKLACEGYAGGIMCEASAAPRARSPYGAP